MIAFADGRAMGSTLSNASAIRAKNSFRPSIQACASDRISISDHPFDRHNAQTRL